MSKTNPETGRTFDSVCDFGTSDVQRSRPPEKSLPTRSYHLKSMPVPLPGRKHAKLIPHNPKGGGRMALAASDPILSVPPAADDEPLDPASGSGRLDAEVQPVAVRVPP